MGTEMPEKRPFNCTEKDCVYRSSRASNMRRHALVHTVSLQPHAYACDVAGCTYRSRFKASLAPHRRRHTGDRPYSCSVAGCPFSTAWSSLRSKHYLTAHGAQAGDPNFSHRTPRHSAHTTRLTVSSDTLKRLANLPECKEPIYLFTPIDISEDTASGADQSTPFCALYVNPRVTQSQNKLIIGGFFTADVDISQLGSVELTSRLLNAALGALSRADKKRQTTTI
jgi:hypothetical protein